MMKKLALSLLCAIVTIAALAVSPTTPAFAAGPAFGSGPYSSVRAAAQVYFAQTGLTLDEFTAVLLAPTWGEVADSVTSNTPSPEAMGRSDWDTKLYFNGDRTSSNPAPRAFHHQGHGIWQEDITGVGGPMSLQDMVAVDTSAMAAARYTAQKWNAAVQNCPNDQAVNTSCKRNYLWRTWNACDSGACDTIYTNQLMPNGVLQYTPTSNIGNYGGGVVGTCTMPGSPYGWTCFRYDPDVAEGFRGGLWYSTPFAGIWDPDHDRRKSPLTARLYSWTSGGNEIRYWNASDIGYTTSIQTTRIMAEMMYPVFSTSSSHICFNTSVCN